MATLLNPPHVDANRDREAVLAFRLSAAYGDRRVLREVSGEVRPGEVLSLVGLSGSGKSTLALAILGLVRYRGGVVSGTVRIARQELERLSERDLRGLRGKLVGYVPQNAASALNGKLRIRTLLEETWRAHSNVRPPEGFWRELLASVRLPTEPAFLDRRAGELSTGQGQRLLIALAIMHNPRLLIADEPTSALDAITQTAVLELFRDLSQNRRLALLFISHDLLSVASMSTRVAILHEGEIVESGTPDEIFLNPRHSFTRELIQAMPARPVFTRGRQELTRADRPFGVPGEIEAKSRG